jgi:hypothetical protein
MQAGMKIKKEVETWQRIELYYVDFIFVVGSARRAEMLTITVYARDASFMRRHRTENLHAQMTKETKKRTNTLNKEVQYGCIV